MSPSTYKDAGERQGGDPNIMKIKDVNTIRPLDNVVAGWRQHGIEHPSDPEQFQSMVCPGARSCPLCRKPVSADGKQHFPVSRRFAANVWDYTAGAVKVLVAGPQVFDAFKSVAALGIDVGSADWTITKSGQGRGTEYKVVRHDAKPFDAAQITPDMLHSVDKYEQPASTEAIFEVLEKFGIDYDALTVPSYTYDEALAFKMPYTKHKGETVEQLLSSEPSFAEWLHGTKLEQGQLGDPVFLALQTAMEERGMVPKLEDALSMLPDEPATAAPQATASASDGVSAASAGLEKLIGPDGAEVMVPPSVVDNMLQAGFKRPEPEPTPAVATEYDANAPMQVLIGGNEVTLPREQALGLIEAGTAERVEDPQSSGAGMTATEPEAAPAPKLPLPDEVVQVDVAGTEVPMPYVQAAGVVDNPASNAKFVDEGVAEAHARSNAAIASAVDPSETPATESASTRKHDPEKPFECDQCDANYKTQGALTQHKNREHKAAEPQPSAIPAASNGGDIAERVKAKIAGATFARDYDRLMTIFDEEVGERNFAVMNEEQLLKLERRIDAEMAAAK